MRPESEPARRFANEVEAYLRATARGERSPVEPLHRQLTRWREAAAAVAERIAPAHARLADVGPVAQAFSNATEFGLEALEALDAGRVCDRTWREACFAGLRVLPDRNPAAVVLPTLPALRELVSAAAEQRPTDAASSEAWLRAVRAAAMKGRTPPSAPGSHR